MGAPADDRLHATPPPQLCLQDQHCECNFDDFLMCCRGGGEALCCEQKGCCNQADDKFPVGMITEVRPTRARSPDNVAVTPSCLTFVGRLP